MTNSVDGEISTVASTESDAWVESFLWDVQRYTNDYIKFADTKAAFTIAASTGLSGSLVASQIFDALLRHGSADMSSLQLLSILALVFLVSSIVTCVWAIRPRVWSNAKPGFIFWESVKLHGTAHNYLRALKEASAAHREKALSEQTFILASIAQQKYRFVGIGLLLFSIGGGLAGLALFISHAQ
jgi:hypothetical protein